MLFIKRNIIFFGAVLMCALVVHSPLPTWAEEGGGGHEAPKEGGEGEGAAEGGEGAAKPAGNGADREWAKRTTKLNVYESKMKELNRKIMEMIEAKKGSHAALDEKGKPIDPLEIISTSFTELKTTVKSYNEEREQLKYKFPEEGVVIERRYVPQRVQTLEQMEKEIGLNGELSLTKRKVDKKYETFMGDEITGPIPQAPKGPESTLKETKPIKNHEEEGPKRLKLSQ